MRFSKSNFFHDKFQFDFNVYSFFDCSVSYHPQTKSFEPKGQFGMNFWIVGDSTVLGFTFTKMIIFLYQQSSNLITAVDWVLSQEKVQNKKQKHKKKETKKNVVENKNTYTQRRLLVFIISHLCQVRFYVFKIRITIYGTLDTPDS